jgi:DNA-directed RNA polymerase specialized sigma24 family protein
MVAVATASPVAGPTRSSEAQLAGPPVPTMNTTSLGLLERLKDAKPGASDWRRLQELYLPLIHNWLSRVPGLRDESGDLAQEVLVVLFRELQSFERRRDGAFRAWLRQITVNRVRAFCKARYKPQHVRLYRDANGAWHAQNNKSPNGLWYRVPQIMVNDACLFQIGEQRLRLRAGG